MIEYANLRFIDDLGWKLLTKKDIIDLDSESFIDAMNEVGKDNWELVLFEEQIGYLFKREVK